MWKKNTLNATLEYIILNCKKEHSSLYKYIYLT